MHLIENDPALSKPLAGMPPSAAGAGDWFVLIDGTDIARHRVRHHRMIGAPNRPSISTGVYRLMWDLAKSDISGLERRKYRRRMLHCRKIALNLVRFTHESRDRAKLPLCLLWIGSNKISL